ncbi:CmcI family methyltransferase [Leifsonia poae]|uniref:CmcI family methyltransferase n=1 Tax=Leifsonia poae TaxID=110933 RepID=UPI003D67F443
MNSSQRDRVQLLAEWASLRLARNRVPNTYDNAVYSIANALKQGTISEPNLDSTIELLEELFELDREDHPKDRFTPLEMRLRRAQGSRALPPLGYLLGQGVNAAPTWRGMPFYKSVWDMALYNELLWELRPGTIIELGSGEGASADWFATMTKAFGIDTEVVSFDTQPPIVPAQQGVTFVPSSFPEDIDRVIAWMETLDQQAPWLIIEDMHVGIEKVLPQLVAKLRPGDYLIVEDSAHKQSVIENLAHGPVTLEVDQLFTDRFGLNGTSAMNSILRVGNQ